MSIELRLSDVNPPAPEPPRTIYRDIVNLPDPVKLGITVHYFNNDAVPLYFQITGSGTGYTFGTVNLGSLASGAEAYINLDEFASKAKPSPAALPNGELEEQITLTLKAYTDAGYSNLKWTYERIVTVHWINSADAAWTQDVLNNFDDGMVQGWAVADDGSDYVFGGYPTIGVATDYVLSAPYSLKANHRTYVRGKGRVYKSFTTPNKSKVFGILDLRLARASGCYIKLCRLTRNATLIITLGKPYDATASDYFIINKWFRAVVPLPANTTIQINIRWETYSTDYYLHYLWLDDFKIISK